MHSLRPTRNLLLLLVLVCGVFAPSLGNGFAMDDVGLAQSVGTDGEPDPVIHGWRAPWWFFVHRYWEGTANDSVLYRPVTVLSYSLTYNAISAPLLSAEWEAFPHHLFNILLHGFAVFLVWWMVRDLGQSELAALVGAALFGLHALHSEVVAGIVGRAELFSFAFGLWATLVFVRGRFVIAGLLFFLAFCSKESALAWAPFLPCYLLARRWAGLDTQIDLRRIAIALAVPLLLFFVLRYTAIRGIEPGAFSWDQNPLAHVETDVRMMTAVKLLGYGLVKCLAPFWLYSLYGSGAVALVESPTDAGFLGALIGLLAWLALGLWFAKRLPLLFLSVAAFLGFSFITSNLPLVIGTIFGERLFYMPSLGVCLLPLLLLERVGKPLLVLLGIWLAANAAVIVVRNGAWKDTETLFIGDADRLPESADLQAKAGYMYRDARKDSEKALEYFHRCVAIDPDFAGTWYSIARIWSDQRKDDVKALEFYERALNSKYVASSGTEDRVIEDYLKTLMRLSRVDAACRYALDVLGRKPAHAFALVLAVDHCRKRTTRRRAELVQNAIQAAPEDAYAVLLHAMLVYETTGGSGPQQNAALAQRLGWSIQNVSFDMFTPETRLKARLYLGDTLAQAGRRRDAVAVFQELLRDPATPASIRAKLEGQIRELSK